MMGLLGTAGEIACPYGVLKLTLHDGSYDWKFLPVEGKSFTDSGTGSCHGRPRD